jgi:hypothetical protein
MIIMLKGQDEEWDVVSWLCNHLLDQFPDYRPLYLRPAETFLSLNRPKESEAVFICSFSMRTFPWTFRRGGRNS